MCREGRLNDVKCWGLEQPGSLTELAWAGFVGRTALCLFEVTCSTSRQRVKVRSFLIGITFGSDRAVSWEHGNIDSLIWRLSRPNRQSSSKPAQWPQAQRQAVAIVVHATFTHHQIL